MKTGTAQVNQSKAWKSLESHYLELKDQHLRNLFTDDPKRGERMVVEALGIYLDYSKNRIIDETLKLLLQLAEAAGLRDRINAMFRGDKINITEKRAVLHVALRAPKEESIILDGMDVVPQVHAVLDKMTDFSNLVRGGQWKGHTGKTIRNIINIGIGGSDLGPVSAAIEKRTISAIWNANVFNNFGGGDLLFSAVARKMTAKCGSGGLQRRRFQPVGHSKLCASRSGNARSIL